MRFSGQVCVLVGGASELATVTGKRLIDEGAKVILIHHNQPSLDRVLPEYEERKVFCYIANITDFETLRDTFNAIAKEHGKIDVMINCAGIMKPAPIEKLSSADWQDVIDVNLTGTFYACKAAATIMQQQKSGKIINVASLAGRTGRPGVGVNYAASKAGMIGLTQALAQELASYGITVNVVSPGPLKGRMFQKLPQATKDKLQAGIPLGRVGEMEEVAGAILFMSSADANWITGEVLDVNGGIFM